MPRAPDDTLAIVLEYSKSAEPQLRRNALVALGALGTEETARQLVRAAVEDHDADVRATAAAEVAALIEDPGSALPFRAVVTAYLDDALDDPPRRLRTLALVRALRQRGHEPVTLLTERGLRQVARAAVEDRDEEVRAAAEADLAALLETAHPGSEFRAIVMGSLEEALADPARQRRAFEVLGGISQRRLGSDALLTEQGLRHLVSAAVRGWDLDVQFAAEAALAAVLANPPADTQSCAVVSERLGEALEFPAHRRRGYKVLSNLHNRGLALPRPRWLRSVRNLPRRIGVVRRVTSGKAGQDLGAAVSMLAPGLLGGLVAVVALALYLLGVFGPATIKEFGLPATGGLVLTVVAAGVCTWRAFPVGAQYDFTAALSLAAIRSTSGVIAGMAFVAFYQLFESNWDDLREVVAVTITTAGGVAIARIATALVVAPRLGPTAESIVRTVVAALLAIAAASAGILLLSAHPADAWHWLLLWPACGGLAFAFAKIEGRGRGAPVSWHPRRALRWGVTALAALVAGALVTAGAGARTQARAKARAEARAAYDSARAAYDDALATYDSLAATAVSLGSEQRPLRLPVDTTADSLPVVVMFRASGGDIVEAMGGVSEGDIVAALIGPDGRPRRRVDDPPTVVDTIPSTGVYRFAVALYKDDYLPPIPELPDSAATDSAATHTTHPQTALIELSRGLGLKPDLRRVPNDDTFVVRTPVVREDRGAIRRRVTIKITRK